MLEPRDILAGDRRLGDALRDAMTRDRRAARRGRTDRAGCCSSIPTSSWSVERRPRESQPRVQLVDVAVGGHARIGLRHARSVEEAGLARIAGLGVDFHQVTIIRARTRRLHSSERPPAVSPAAARVVSAARTRPALAADERSVSHPRLRSDAAADAGRSRAAEIPRVAGEVSDAARRWRRAPEDDVAETWRPLGYNIRPRRLHAIARESVERYGGALPSDETTLRSFKGIGEYTAGAVLSFAFGKRAAILDTNVARVLFRVFVGRGDPKAHAMKRSAVGHVANGAAAPPRVRLQPGADGFRRDGVRGAEAEMPALPDAARLRGLPVQSGQRTLMDPATRPRVVVAAAVIEHDGRFLVTRRPTGVHLEGYWEFPGGKCEAGRNAGGLPAPRDRGGARDRQRGGRRAAGRQHTTTPSAASSCISSPAGFAANPGRCSGRRCDGSPATT